VLTVVADDKTARQMVLQRLREREAANLRVRPRVSLDTLFSEIQAGKMKDLNIIIKTDVEAASSRCASPRAPDHGADARQRHPRGVGRRQRIGRKPAIASKGSSSRSTRASSPAPSA
jgi:hypothetical protein